MKIHYQCSNCGRKFIFSIVFGSGRVFYDMGCRAVGDAFYCDKCVKTWKERNGKEFDEQHKNPKKMFADWWNRILESQEVKL